MTLLRQETVWSFGNRVLSVSHAVSDSRDRQQVLRRLTQLEKFEFEDISIIPSWGLLFSVILRF